MPRQLRPRHPTTGLAFRPELGRFGNLPRELRDQIYFYFYGGWCNKIDSNLGGGPYTREYPYREAPFYVSRRFSEEVAHTLYSTTQFIFKGPDPLQLFLDQIAEGHRHNITKVYLIYRRFLDFGANRSIWEKQLLRLQGIKYLTIPSTVVGPTFYDGLDHVGDRVVEIRDSKLFPKLELATIRWCYPGDFYHEIMEIYLEEMQRFFARDL